MQNKAKNPIGIFDSGIGGLTVAKAVMELLPNESIVYFGDIAHLPYGDKSSATIQQYSRRIADRLLQENCKLILIACNSASAAAYDVLKKHIAGRALLLNVIDPTVRYLQQNFAGKKVGLIGTKLTVNSKAYHKKIGKLKANIALQALATPLLVPMLEEGFYQHQIIDVLLHEYLSHRNLRGIEALVLACTHYPVIKKNIAQYYGDKVTIIDSSAIVALAIEKELSKHDLLNSSGKAKTRFLVSDYTAAFAQIAKLFFGKKIRLERA
jgi:glutamate racemase